MEKWYDMSESSLDYATFVEDAINKDTQARRSFGNRGVEHAAPVLSSMLRNSYESFDALAGLFSADVIDPLLIRQHLKATPNLVIRLVLDGQSPNDKSALSALRDEIEAGRILVRILNRDKYELPNVHLAVSDKINVRLESDKSNRRARVIFKDPEIGSATQKTFDKFWEVAEPANIEQISEFLRAAKERVFD